MWMYHSFFPKYVIVLIFVIEVIVINYNLIYSETLKKKKKIENVNQYG